MIHDNDFPWGVVHDISRGNGQRFLFFTGVPRSLQDQSLISAAMLKAQP